MKAQLGQVVGIAVAVLAAAAEAGESCDQARYIGRQIEPMGWTVEDMVLAAGEATSDKWLYESGLSWLLDD